MAKISKLHERIEAKRREKFTGVAQLPKINDKNEFVKGDRYRADLIYKNQMELKTRELTTVVDAANDLVLANRTNRLMTEFDEFELTGALQLLVSDAKHFDARMEEIAAKHDHKPIKMSGAHKATPNPSHNQQSAVALMQHILEVADAYTAMAEFYVNVIQRDLALIISVITRFEMRQEQMAKIKGLTLPA